ncbi:polysaccharide deacetylase family protein [Cohnella sp. WQ 127256]|uniref:polysaccharide deacetylase family protein n=1 Tax=Cohnella sp. WQ 127256 TaxID=2938790 RepID=UPI002118790C|nr:polysaccharide deacetylase family protein [Cohnella sp. WQ 127256]
MLSVILHQVHTRRKALALTFDDGPNPIYTRGILDLLKEVSGKATFFMIGEQMENYPDVVRAVDSEGHEIGNHTYSHPYLSRISKDECKLELKRTEILIHKLTGKRPRVFRPPYLEYNEDVVAVSESAGYRMIGALNLDAQDWGQPGAGHIFDKSLECVRNGSILMFHDGYGDRSQTMQAVGWLLQILSTKGYQLVTVSELLASEQMRGED